MARTLSLDELLDRAEAQVAKEYPNSDPAEMLIAILRYRVSFSVPHMPEPKNPTKGEPAL